VLASGGARESGAEKGTGVILMETTTIDALNHTMKGHTDGAGRVIEAVDAENNVSHFTYDAQGNRLRSRDANAIGTDNTFAEKRNYESRVSRRWS